jgi:exonuclease SbcD
MRDDRVASLALSPGAHTFADVRLIHTSDWHLGRTFHRVGMLDAQARFLDDLVDVVAREKVDAVVVAGDIYDRALPSVDTVALLDDALVRLRAAGAQVILSSGNHDSAQRLGFGSRVMAAGGVHVRTDPRLVAVPVLLEDEHGPVAIYPIPYLEPSLVGDAIGIAPGVALTHQSVLTHAMGAVRADLAERGPGTRSVVAAHAFVVGGVASDSERDISVGGVAAVPLSVFDRVDYAALGHLHGRATLSETVRYSGSPIAYSFSEVDQRKGSWLVDLGPDGVRRVDFVPAPVTRPLAILRGSLEDLLADPAHAAAESAYCQVTLTDSERPRSAMERIRTRFPHTLMLSFEPEGAATSLRDYTSRVRGRSDLDVCCDFLEHVRGGSPATEAERALLQQAVEAVRDGDAETARPAPARRDVGAA